eukprot:2571567-Rhodomonas_salina.1
MSVLLDARDGELIATGAYLIKDLLKERGWRYAAQDKSWRKSGRCTQEDIDFVKSSCKDKRLRFTCEDRVGKKRERDECVTFMVKTPSGEVHSFDRNPKSSVDTLIRAAANHLDLFPEDLVLCKGREYSLSRHDEDVRRLQDLVGTGESACCVDLKIEENIRFYVSIEGGSDSADGSRENPFKTTEHAFQAYLAAIKAKPHGWTAHGTDVSVQCSAGLCPMVTCFARGCQTRFCLEHDDGKGRYFKGGDFDDPAIWFHGGGDARGSSMCGAEDCPRAFCFKHRDANLGSCDVCRHGSDAEVSMGMYDSPGRADAYCHAHLITCNKRIREEEYATEGEDDDDEEASENASEASHADYEQEADADGLCVCYFKCCPRCLHEHQCGFDVSEYF